MDTDIICNTNNNNYLNNKNEILFKKVFNNKFLFNKIIKYVQSMEWVLYNNHKQLHINNRLKLKNINSLHWMLKHKQYKLIDYKLNKNDYIHVDKSSIEKLFKLIETNNKNKNNNNNNNINNMVVDDNENNNNFFKELLIKFLEKKRNQFEIIDLTATAVVCDSLDVLKLLVNKPYSMLIYQSTFDFAIDISCKNLVYEIFKRGDYSIGSLFCFSQKYPHYSETDEYNDFEKFEKVKKKEETILESIAKTHALLASGTVRIPSSFEQPFKRLKPSNDFNDQEVENLFNHIYSIDSLHNLSKYHATVNYELLKNIVNSNISTISNPKDVPFQQQIEIFIILKCKKTNQKAYIRFYKNYINKYKEIIEECHIDNDDDGQNVSFTNVVDGAVDNLLKYHKFFSVLDIFEKISGFKKSEIILDCKDGILEWKEWLLDLVVLDKVDFDIPKIDWVLNCKNNSIISLIKNKFSKLSIKTLELADYVYVKTDLVNHVTTKNDFKILIKIYSDVWNNAINTSDFNTMKYIQSLDIGDLYINFMFPEYIGCFDKVVKLINHFNQTDFKKFQKNGICGLINIITKVLKDGGNVNKDHKYTHIPYINFSDNNFPHIVPFLKKAVSEVNIDLLNILLNSSFFNNIESNVDRLNFSQYFIQFPKYLFNINTLKVFQYNKMGKEDHDASNYSRTPLNVDDVISFIRKLLLKRNGGGDGADIINNNDDNYTIESSLSFMVNYIFDKLIQMEGVSMEQVKEIYKLIQENSITVKHSFFHSFYYLHIKSIKYSFYILSPHIVTLLYRSGGGDRKYYNCISDGKDYDLGDYLNPKDFTLDSIDKLPFDTVLAMLDHQIYPIIDSFYKKNDQNNVDDNGLYNRNRFINQLNRDLEYYLIIRRVDLFFKKLGSIKSNLDNETENNCQQQNTTFNLLSPFQLKSVLYNSPSSTILPNSNTIFNNENYYGIDIDPPALPLKLIENFKNFEFQPIELVVNTFTFSKKIIKSICSVLDIEEIKNVIKFNYYQTSFQDHLLQGAIISGRLDIIKLLLDNFKINLFIDYNKFNGDVDDDDDDDNNNNQDEDDDDDDNHDDDNDEKQDNIRYKNSPNNSKIESLSFIFKNYFKLVENPCKLKSIKNEKLYQLFKFKFLQLLENHFQQTENHAIPDDKFKHFICQSTPIDKKIEILKKSFLIIKSDLLIDSFKFEVLSKKVVKNYFYNSSYQIDQSNKFINICYQNDYQLLFKDLFHQLREELYQYLHQHQPPYCCKYNQLEDNIFLKSFIYGDIQLCELILSYYPNYNFKITKSSITTAINNGNIHIINHFLKNHTTTTATTAKTTTTTKDDNTDLINHLKSELNNHYDYKYLNQFF